jgi:ankyrin repeat protein
MLTFLTAVLCWLQWGWTALMWASYKGRIIVVQELLDRGANPNAKADVSTFHTESQ